jgi:hypothetical protein
MSVAVGVVVVPGFVHVGSGEGHIEELLLVAAALMRPRRKVFTGGLVPVAAFLVGEAG